uniref:Uncharacterized protein n=1 Tax=Anguilla anguilla TaxID=7936 RepID=A0A0E9V9D5_ANGAN
MSDGAHIYTKWNIKLITR